MIPGSRMTAAWIAWIQLVPQGALEEDSPGACLEPPVDVLVGVEGGDHHDRDGLLDFGPREETRRFDAVQVRHADVEKAHVRARPTRESDGLAPVGGLAHDLDVGLAAQDRGEPGPDDALVIGDEHGDRHVTPPVRGVRHGRTSRDQVPVRPSASRRAGRSYDVPPVRGSGKSCS